MKLNTIKMIIAILCIASLTLVVLTESGVIRPHSSKPKKLKMMPQDSFINLLNRVCKIPEDLNVKPSKMNDKCFLDLYFLHDKVGLDSHELYDGVQYWDKKMTELSGDDALTGHSYYSKEMVNFKMTYSYHNYVEPVLQEANDLAARNAKDIAGNCLTFAAVLAVVLFVLCRFTKPDSFALPMPNFYETSKTQRKSSFFVKLQNYFHGPESLDLPLPGAYKTKKSKYIV